MTKLFDVSDDISWEERKNYTLLHSIERVRIYQKEQFNYRIIKVNIDE